jgi:formylglycine-generating enzyme required for sulfatase activity
VSGEVKRVLLFFYLRLLLILSVCGFGIAHADDNSSHAATAGENSAASREVKAFKDCADCPEMVVIPAGSFQMGGSGSAAEKPIHTVTIAAAFALARTELTQGQWRAVMGTNPSVFSSCGDSCPVERVSWDDAQEFVRKLNARTGKTYRLPSEAEWEYACRAGGQQEYCGSDSLDMVGWYGAYANPVGNSAMTINPVGRKQANAWGLYDMSGNVWEWTQDCWNATYNGAPSDGSAWTTGQCAAGRVLRGGAWDRAPQVTRAGTRNGADTTHRNYNLGFRLARMLP